MNLKKRYLLFLLLSVIILGSVYVYFQPSKSEITKKLDTMNLEGYDEIMIVAHPDDETLWGGSHLNNGKYLVLCITNEKNPLRTREFNAIIKQSGSLGMMLSYPDKTNGKRDDWSQVDDAIYEDIDDVIGYKKWKHIATHNPDGEYGHIHHKMTSNMVFEACKQHDALNQLFYFGNYYKKKEMAYDLNGKLDDIQLQKKMALLERYSSQKQTIDKLSHMIPYENWIPYADWSN